MSPAISCADNYARSVAKLFSPFIGQSLLEVGTGYGNYKQYLPPLKRYTSIDVDAEVVEHARAVDKGGRYYVADVSEDNLKDILGEEKYDTILCVNVLEHIEEQKKALLNMLNVLEFGGYLLIFVPAHMSLYCKLDKMAGHFRRYSMLSLKEVLKGLPCDLINLEYFNPIGAVGWWINKIIPVRSIRQKHIAWQVNIFDRFILPLSIRLNCLTKKMFGQSLVCVVRRS